MNATVRLLRWLGIGAMLGSGIRSTVSRHDLIPALLPVLMLGGMTLVAQAQYQFRSEVNADGTLTVYQGSLCPRYRLIIPDTIDGRKVTGIGGWAFYECHGLTNITIPDSVTSIGDQAFEGCTGLSSVTLPDSVISLGDRAFANCIGLTSVTIPDSVTSMGDYAFSSCTNLANVWLGKGLTVIANGAFDSCLSLPTITIPAGVRQLGGRQNGGEVPSNPWPFGNCGNLTRVFFEGAPPTFARFERWLTGDFREPPTVYYLPGAPGWSSEFGGHRTAAWVRPSPTILDFGDRFGPTTNGFSFVISWATNVPVVVEASADVSGAGRTPISTNTLTDGWMQFTDPEWKSKPARFYRARGQ